MGNSDVGLWNAALGLLPPGSGSDGFQIVSSGKPKPPKKLLAQASACAFDWCKRPAYASGRLLAGWHKRRLAPVGFRIVFPVLLLFCLLPFLAAAQTASSKKTPDLTESKTMASGDFFRLILKNHPVARQAALLTQQAKSEIRLARGEFDPKLEAFYENKQLFDEKKTEQVDYYHHWESALKIPLWIGELKGGYERNVGTYTNPETTTGAAGLVFAGISMPLPISRDFVIDQRRAALRQAQVFRNIAEADRVKEINKLMLNAAKDYWEWYFAYNEYAMLQEAFTFADVRYRAVRGRVTEGDLAGIDSVDAQTALQDRTIRLQQATVDLMNARLRMSNYLWGENDVPLEMPGDIAPEGFASDRTAVNAATLQRLRDLAQANHPELRKLVFKNDQLTIERRFLRDRFKPNARLNYNALSTSANIVPADVGMAYLRNNYKWGFEFGFPVFLRKERGKLSLNEIKIEQNDFERQQANREILNNLQATYNELQNLDILIRQQEALIANYRRLRDAEVQKFDNGESSLFLINARETKLIDEQVKLFSFKTKYAKEKAELLWAAGLSSWEEL